MLLFYSSHLLMKQIKGLSIQSSIELRQMIHQTVFVSREFVGTPMMNDPRRLPLTYRSISVIPTNVRCVLLFSGTIANGWNAILDPHKKNANASQVFVRYTHSVKERRQVVFALRIANQIALKVDWWKALKDVVVALSLMRMVYVKLVFAVSVSLVPSNIVPRLEPF